LSEREEGRHHVLREVAIVKDDAHQRHLVREAAAIALRADARGREVEREVMRHIDAALETS
jgi:hypothetical protein